MMMMGRMGMLFLFPFFSSLFFSSLFFPSFSFFSSSLSPFPSSLSPFSSSSCSFPSSSCLCWLVAAAMAINDTSSLSDSKRASAAAEDQSTEEVGMSWTPSQELRRMGEASKELRRRSGLVRRRTMGAREGRGEGRGEWRGEEETAVAAVASKGRVVARVQSWLSWSFSFSFSFSSSSPSLSLSSSLLSRLVSSFNQLLVSTPSPSISPAWISAA
mmetsp:Transcript_24982/g.45177  ORF Transcript_24982/g.45177 Transcript_24982/m.45177 type:complete len:215 (-) Transcript_24982:434-1078(-)